MEIKNLIKEWISAIDKQKQELGQESVIYKNIEVTWQEDSFVIKIINALDQSIAFLENTAYQQLISDTL